MKILRSLLLALCLIAVSGVAAAGDRHDRGHDRHDRHGWQDRGHGHGSYDRHDRHDRRVRHHRDRYVIRQYEPRRHHWQRGHRYGGPVYVVHDYHHRHLRRPPHGYHWVRADNNDYLLVALATGIILDIATR